MEKITYIILGLVLGTGLTVFAATSSTIIQGTSGSFAVGTSTAPVFTGLAGANSTYLTVVAPNSDQIGGIEIGNSTSTAYNGVEGIVGGIQFVNTDNLTSTTTDSQGRAIAVITAQLETSNGNADKNSGGNLAFFTKPATGAMNIGRPNLIIQQSGHLQIGAAGTPIVSGCGTTPTNYGNDTRGRVYVGTGTITSCTLTFVNEWSDNPPVCRAQQETGTAVMLKASSTLATLVVTSSADMATDAFVYACDVY